MAGSVGLGVIPDIPVSAAASVSIGGTGATGGVSGDVSVASNGGVISTTGNSSKGILAQSVGGGGGSGGFSGAISFAADQKVAVALSASVGGSGGSGNTAGSVDVQSGSSIVTKGDDSQGILAQSVGGGGGNGAFSAAISASAGSKGLAGVSFSLGGDGGTGGDSLNDPTTGVAVSVNSTGSWITTSGEGSQGIFAQSVGGGGGNGGVSLSLAGSIGGSTVTLSDIPLLNLGNKAGGAGDGGAVSVKNESRISTTGDYSQGVLAQSVGAGGGAGGIKISGSASLSASDKGGSTALSFGVNMLSGTEGGDAGAVNVENSNSISTTGDYSQGILAQSVGGGGGAGGTNITGSFSFNLTEKKFSTGLSFGAAGKTGAGGGDADAVTVTETLGSGATAMYISTEGVNSAGILAQSIGGGGGAGGITFKGGLSVTSMSYLPSLSFNSGGGGGTGGSAGAVSVTGVSSIQTLGESSPGILAQSVGGGGGSGGISIGVSAEGSISIIEGLNVTMGGNGGSGGDADSVTVTSGGGFITTAGNSSSGIVAQSVGGGGGSGGGSISASIGVGAAILPPLTASIGGKGGTGGKAAAVTVANSGSITTGAVNTGTGLFLTGNDSYGILAQSVGGGGGNAGFSISARADLGGIIGGTSLSFGGEGGTGNTAGDVQVTSTGSLIRTLGDRSTGILAQSIGGGGGNAGFSIAGGVTNGVELSVSAGGNGGSGGDAGVVRVTNTGSISTGYIDPDSAVHGHDSAGIQAQSIGGGGGSGGFSVSAAVATSDASISIGGSGGGTGNGGNVTINNTGDAITTLGDRSTGILAQSIGGGGGSGGFSVGGQLTLVGAGIGMSFGCAGGGGGNGGSVTINDSGRLIVTSGDRSTGILAQSIGGGGGTGGLSAAQGIGSAGAISLSLGSGDASGGNGGSVSVTTASGIVTSGDDSAGILAQSVGNGGGFGGIDVSGDLAGASSMTAALGASGTGNGDGGDLSLISTGSAITTSGDRSHGILAQSIGGGGGAASIGVTGSVEATSAAVTLGGQNGGSGTGGTVSVQNASGIEAAGAGSYGIIAQSIGGGGGLDAVNGNAGSAGGTGTGGPVTVNNSGNIVTQGSYAHAIIAQSIGGTGTGGPVAVTNGGNILAEGAGSDAILAQSTGGSGGNISVTIQDGIVRGGSGTGSAVRILEGAVNTLTNYGTLVSKGGPLGNALIATTGDETINNFGTIAGSVDLGTGNSTFNNMTGSWFLPGTTVNLGGTGTLTNKGTLSPGGLENVVTTTVTGNYVQQSSGVYAVDIDTRAGTADHVKVSGATALAGWVAPNIANKGFALPGTQQVTIVTGNTGITNNGLKVIQASAAAQYELVYPNATDVALRTSIDFAPAGLTGNQAVIGNNINSILLAGGSASLAPVVARLLYLPSVQALGEAFDRLSPAPFMAMSTAATHSNIGSQTRCLAAIPVTATTGSRDRSGASGRVSAAVKRIFEEIPTTWVTTATPTP